MAIVKKRVGTFAPESPEEQFAQILTPYALDFVVKQINFEKRWLLLKIMEHTQLFHLLLKT